MQNTVRLSAGKKIGQRGRRCQEKGYEDKQIVLRSGLNNASILNLTFWPSWLTDVATGGMWQYSRDGIYIDMENPTLPLPIGKSPQPDRSQTICPV